MAIDRRSFVAGVLGFLAPRGSPAAREVHQRALIAAAMRQPDGSYAAIIHDIDKGLMAKAVLPGRGHDVAVNPMSGVCVAFARRPGTFAVAFGAAREHAPMVFSTPPDRHFYGHGVSSPDGRFLDTTENAFEQGAGCIGVWEVAARFRRIAELPSHGIGPHDINLMPDGRTLVITNGGIVTHPDHGRRPLNVPTMEPSLVYLDARSGDLLERHALPASQHKLSIRHLDVAGDGTVVFGCQNKGPRSRRVDLVGFHRRQEDISFLVGGDATHRAPRHYVSSVAIDRGGEIAAVTSSRGRQVVLIDTAKRSVIEACTFPDVSGVAAGRSPGRFALTGGNGDIAVCRPSSPTGRRRQTKWQWDNHAIALPG